jgi:hypothetical protein
MLTLKHLEEISMIQLHPEFITKNGQKELAVIPYEQFEALQALIPDIEDLMDLRAAKEEDAFSAFCTLSRGEENVRIIEGCRGD